MIAGIFAETGVFSGFEPFVPLKDDIAAYSRGREILRQEGGSYARPDVPTDYPMGEGQDRTVRILGPVV